MQYFQDTAGLLVWAFNPDVIVTNTAGVYSFTTAAGVALTTPTTLQPCAAPVVAGPTSEQQAATLLAAKIASGIALTSASTPALNATYALNSVSIVQIFQIGMYANQFGMFPSGGATQAYPDATRVPHSFTVVQFLAFLHAVAPLISALETQAGVMTAGGAPAWPNQSVQIA